MQSTAGMVTTLFKESTQGAKLFTKAASQKARSAVVPGTTGKPSCTSINSKMPTPTIEKVFKDGEWVWEVSYAGTVQYHKQDWQAKWLYEQAVQAYSRKDSS
jgi:hypothetical protein